MTDARNGGSGSGRARKRRGRRRRSAGQGTAAQGAVHPARGNGKRPRAAAGGATRKPRHRRARSERSAGGIVVRHGPDGPLFLLIRDSYGHWGFPKGHLERGEPSDAAAVREVMEETGIDALSIVASITTIDWFFRFRGRLIHKHCEFFLMETSVERTRPQKAEGITACQWTSIDEAERLIAYENARGVLRRARELLGLGAPPSPAAATP
jgi:8-oxo-dGTP pyrophosphatase MutT (NUDIX family)